MRITRGFAVLAVLALLAPASAQAAFPGANGKIAFAGNVYPAGDYDVWTVSEDGSNPVRLTSDPADDFGPAWTSDGARIAFWSARDGNEEIYVMNADGTSQTRITSNAASDVDPTWSSDGGRIAFASNRDGDFDIYTMKNDGTDVVQITNDPTSEVNPAWSPDGRRIAFRRSKWIYVVNVDGTGANAVTSGNATTCGDHQNAQKSDSEPNWSPDGQWLAYIRNDDLDGDDCYVLVKIRPDGTGRTVLPDTIMDRHTPAWSPDGRRLVFEQLASLSNVAADGSDQRDMAPTTYALDPDWQPLPVNTPSAFARPKGATPFRASLVPAFQACMASNRTHGAPLAFPSCAPPAPGSSSLTVGVGDGSPALSKSIGSMRVDVMPTDVNLRMSLTNVMNASDLSDYTGQLHASMSSRLSDKEGTVASTRMDFPFAFDVPCTATPDTTLGGDCRILTSFNSVLPGSSTSGLRTNWEMGRFEVYDGTGALLATQGVFVP